MNIPNDQALQEALNEADCCVAADIPIPAHVWSTLIAYGVDASAYSHIGIQQEIDFCADDNQAYTEKMLREDEEAV